MSLIAEVEAMLRDMVAELPALQLFDAGQERTKPRHLDNARTRVGVIRRRPTAIEDGRPALPSQPAVDWPRVYAAQRR